MQTALECERSAMASRPISQSVSHSKNKSQQKPEEWISTLIQRYQDQLPTGTGKVSDRESRELLLTTHLCIVNVGKHHSITIMQGLVRVLKAVNASKWTAPVAIIQSRLFILSTILDCLQETQPFQGRNLDRDTMIKNVLNEMWIIIQSGNAEVVERAICVVSRVGDIAAPVSMARAEMGLNVLQDEDNTEEAIQEALSFVSLMSHVSLDLDQLCKFLHMVNSLWPPRKEHLESVCCMISAVMWKFIEKYPDTFSSLQHSPYPHVTEATDTLFNTMNTPDMKRRCVCWPVQMLLIAVSPCSLEAISHAQDTQGLPNLPEHVIIKRQFVDMVASTVQSERTQSKSPATRELQYACQAAVNLCKIATFVNQSDFFVFNVVQHMIEHVKSVLLTGSRPKDMDRNVLVDCFVALFRLKFDNDVFRVCLNTQQPLLQLVLVEALSAISAQPSQLPWWPRIEMLSSRSDQLRALLLSTLDRVLEAEPVISTAHLPIGMSRSWHKVSGRWRVERASSASLASVCNQAECSHTNILTAILKLITSHPTLLITKRVSKTEEETREEGSSIESIVSNLVLLIDHPHVHSQTMQALLALHRVIPEWHQRQEATLKTFLNVNSHMLFSVCQKLIHLQMSNAFEVITWLNFVMLKRQEYLSSYTDPIESCLLDGIATQAIMKFEVVCYLYLWNCAPDLVVASLGLFHTHLKECNGVLSANLDSSLSKIMSAVPHSTIMTAGRIALQKSVNRVLRGLPHSNAATHEAWHETFRIWEMFTNQLVNKCSDHSEFVEHVTKVTSDGTEVSSMIDSWSSMSAFLCALSHLIWLKEPNHVTTFMVRLLGVLRMDDSAYRELMCKCVKEELSYEVHSSLDQFLLQQISSQLSGHSSNILFVEHCIYILKNILSRRQGMVLRVDSTSEIMNALLQSQNTVERNPHQRMTFTRKMCSFLQVVVSNGSARRLPSTLQSRMLECMAGAVATLPPATPFSPTRTELLLSILNALSRFLGNMTIPIQPAPFNKLFNDLLDSFADASLSHSSPVRSKNPVEEIANASLAPEMVKRCNDSLLTTLAALVNASPELGVTRVLDTAWGGEWRVRGYMLEILSRVVVEHSSPSMAADRQGSQSELLRLLCQPAEDGSLHIVNSLALSLPNESIDTLCRVCVSAFSERGEMGQLIYSVLWSEAESATSPATLFRGSSFAAKLLSWSMRMFGHAYLLETLRPLMARVLSTPDVLYEVEDRGEIGSVEETIGATIAAADFAFHLIINSVDKANPRFKQVCSQVSQVINTRFPGQGPVSLGKILFLRFINPAIVSPFEHELVTARPNRRISRGLTLISKLLQATANGPSITRDRDPSIQPFQPLIDKWTEPLKGFLAGIIEDTAVEDQASSPAPSTNQQLLLNAHQLFVTDKQEVLRQLSFVSNSPLYSRVDALLKSLPDTVIHPAAPTETLDPALPFFIHLNEKICKEGGGAAIVPIYAIVIRRLQNVEIENVNKQIGEKCGRTKWICLLDGLMCYEAPNLMKMFPADAFAHIEQVLVLNASTTLYNKLLENFSLLQTMRINFDPISLATPLEFLPPRSRALLSPPTHSFPAALISNEEIPVTIKLYENMMVVIGSRPWGNDQVPVADVYQCTDFEQLEMISPSVLTLVQPSSPLVSLRCEAATLLSRLMAERQRMASVEQGGVIPPLRANSLHLISLAFVHLADGDVAVRSTAYRLLCVLSDALKLPTAASLQETPCVFVPSNSLEFLECTASALVSHEPSLLTILVPRLLDMGSVTLLYSLADAWQLIAQLKEESRAELFGSLSMATEVGGALGTAICCDVWPRIGTLDNVTLHTLLNRLMHACPLASSLQVVQAACRGGDRLAALIVERTISQVSAREPRVSLSRLMAFLLVITFDADVTFLESHLAHLMHIISCVSGTGPPFLRCATYTLVSNIFQSFGANTKLVLSDDARRSLGLFLRQLANEDTMRLFRIYDYDNGQEVVEMIMNHVQTDTSCGDRSEDSDYESICEEDVPSSGGKHANLHQILNLIITAVNEVQGEGGSSRDWLVEWRVLSRHWAFEGRGEVQIRSLIAFSSLAHTLCEAEMKSIFQLLVQVIKRRESLSSVAGVALSLVRVHTLTPSNSSIHRLVFWISIVLFQLENAVVYEHAIQLLHANLSHLDQMGVFEHTSLEKLVMEARTPLEWDLKTLDQFAGLSFRANFNFSLVGYLLKGLRQPSLCMKVVQLLHLLLRISAKSGQESGVHSNPYVLTKHNLAFLLALLPFDEKVMSRFRLTSRERLPSERILPSNPFSTFSLTIPAVEKQRKLVPAPSVWQGTEEEEEDSHPLLDPHILDTEQQQSLAATVLAIHARSCPNIDFVLMYLLEAVTLFPGVVPIVESLLDQRITGLVQSCTSSRMLNTLVRLIENSVTGETPGPQPQQLLMLQQSGMAGLWRYPGVFLNPRASLQAINSNLCSCLECILASL
ncbi:hypothetical protein PRIPAC_93862 [Pristionchus pacificus]|nr:hypothetical protein PRIPAC_93862 [Pristionchus pacificus]